MAEDAKHRLDCPHPDCAAGLIVRDSTPAGEYECRCRACAVRVSWSFSLQKGRKPYLSLVKEAEDATA